MNSRRQESSSEEVVPYAAQRRRPREKPAAGTIPFEGILLGVSLLGTAGGDPAAKAPALGDPRADGSSPALLERVQKAPRRQAALRERTAP